MGIEGGGETPVQQGILIIMFLDFSINLFYSFQADIQMGSTGTQGLSPLRR